MERSLVRSPQAWRAIPSACCKSIAVSPCAFSHLPWSPSHLWPLLSLPWGRALLMGLPLSSSVASPHPKGGQARGDNLQQWLRLEKKEEAAQSGQLNQPTASVIPLPRVPALFCLCAACIVRAAPPSPCPHGTASLQHPGREMGKRDKEEAAGHQNLPELFPALPCSVLVEYGLWDRPYSYWRSEAQTWHPLISSEEGWEPDLNQLLYCSSAPYSQQTQKF